MAKKFNVTIAQVVVIEADNAYRAAGIAARQYDTEVLSVEDADSAVLTTSAPRKAKDSTAKPKPQPKGNMMLRNAAKKRWAPGGDLRIAADKRKADAKKRAAKKR